VKEFLEEVRQFFQPEADKLKIALHINAEAALRVTGNKDALKQVFVNLFNNSKEALGGNAGRIDISAKLRHNQIEITFSDSGPGILAELHEKVFTPYFTTKEAGTGLGLPTVHKIISEMGGDVRIRSGVSEGTTFLMTFPSDR
jgi:signal transduction histidine kinase